MSVRDEATAAAGNSSNGPIIFSPRNGALSAGGKSQQLAPANASRKFIIVQNPGTPAGQNLSATESLFIRFGLAAGVNDGTSFEILPGSSMEFETVVSTEAVSVNAATTGHRWIAVEA